VDWGLLLQSGKVVAPHKRSLCQRFGISEGLVQVLECTK
jgi:hypothetical protein